jgi:hypothetical protein
MADYAGRQAKQAAKKAAKNKTGEAESNSSFQQVNLSELNSSANSRKEGQSSIHDASLLSAGGNSNFDHGMNHEVEY